MEIRNVHFFDDRHLLHDFRDDLVWDECKLVYLLKFHFQGYSISTYETYFAGNEALLLLLDQTTQGTLVVATECVHLKASMFYLKSGIRIRVWLY